MIKILIEDTQNMIVVPVPFFRHVLTNHILIKNIGVTFELCWVKNYLGAAWVADEKHFDIWILPFEVSNQTRKL